MRILVTGKGSQLGRALAERSSTAPGLQFDFAGRERLDLESPERFVSVLDTSRPDVIINAAAETAVDIAERVPDYAMKVNAAAPGRLAELAGRRGVRFVQISTSFVFSGDKPEPYTEFDRVDPRTAYGQSKMAGEMRVREALDNHVIVRSAWLYSPFGQSFVRTMLRLAADRDEVRVIDDQWGNPTSADDLAAGLIAMCNYWLQAPEMGVGRTFHLAARGSASWAEFAEETYAISRQLGGPSARVKGIPAHGDPIKGKRPANARLDSELFRETFGYRAPDWRQSLRPVVERLLRDL
ncbi:MAG: dTDP-4-dehydrorhamnose reductase [Alphaproteobacteria bacterium]|nr:dTDP-4-dehydrorhamnose reductase [Alphaproteobacteria bacterium]